jgi:hypothetical protein
MVTFEVELSAPSTEPAATTHGLTLQALGDGGRGASTCSCSW